MEEENNLIKKINNIPELPGVYFMKDKNNNIIYIGKSISLKKRVKSYFYNQKKSKKIDKMVFLICDIDYIVTQTHLEAKLEECRLIKKYKPIFNVQYKNDYKYCFIKIDYNNKKILSISKEEDENSLGVFRNKTKALEFINAFSYIYPIIKSGDSYDFRYNILPRSLNKEEFDNTFLSIKEILSNQKNIDKFIDLLTIKRDNESSKLKFENAGFYNKLIENINVIKRFSLIQSVFKDRHIILRVNNNFKDIYFSIYNGKIIDKKNNPNEFSNKIDNIKSKGESFIVNKKNYDYLQILLSEMYNKDNLVTYL